MWTEKVNHNISALEHYGSVMEYFKNIVDYHIIYNNNFLFNCQYCEKENFTNLLTFKNALSFLSEDNFYTLTEWIHTLMYYDNCSRSDILEMSPVQRMLEINYFKETKKKLLP